jgi:hypothetical protein
MPAKREVITNRGASRYIRRDEKGRFTTYQVDAGPSAAADRKAEAVVPKGQGDHSDPKRS